MSPLDDELRRVLAAHADDAALQTDPLAGIERAARSIRRRRTGTAVLGAAMSVALVALAVPVFRGSLDADSRKERVTGTPTPSTTDAAIPAPSRRPLNAFPWHRSVAPADFTSALHTWADALGYGDLAEGQPLWEGVASGVTGRIIVLQAWTSDDSLAGDAHTVTALVGGPYVDTVTVGDEISYFTEQQPGEGASATKYDVQRTTHVTASYVLADHTAKTVLVVRPDIRGATVDGSAADVSTGGAIVDRAATPARTVHVVLTDDRGRPVADHNDQPAAGSVLADSPLRWRVTSEILGETPTDSTGAMAIEVDSAAAVAALKREVAGLGEVAALTTVSGPDTAGSVQLVVGEYAEHGWGATDSAYVAAYYLAERGQPGRLIGQYDLQVGITSISGVIPADFYRHQTYVQFTPATGWHARYSGSDSPSYVNEGFEPFSGDQTDILATPMGSDSPVIREGVGQGLTFPDV